MITVVNRRKEPRTNGYYIGRPSPLGNPFRIGMDGSRREVIAVDESCSNAKPANGDEPTFDDSVYFLETCCREK